MTWLIRTKKTKLSSAKHHSSILNTVLFLVFGTVQVSATAQRLTKQAISNHYFNIPRYGSIWDVNQLYEYWNERPERNLISNEEIQTMKNIQQQLASHSNNLVRERCDVRRTNDPRACPKEPFLEQDSIASALVKNHCEKQATQIISKQRGGARVSEGDVLQQSPLGDDLQLSPQEILASPLSLPIISTNHIVEAESSNDHESANVWKSQLQKDDHDVEPQEEAQNSVFIKDSDRATTAGAQK
ncbi:MAG: hypothetical protein EZS28_008620 [Streblomastix strix]|uniref:Uncharacterized protein n=1 Tax=Streblomastix strix TaxID=222440 RepID=A0A5J4WNS4_9EUKA|nr:MAG: hypothetical protein EZS28_008620 [Streblomastix strix]